MAAQPTSHSTAQDVRRTDGQTSRGIAYERCGSGPPVLMLHGWCLNRRLWMYEAEFLADRFEVIVPDLAGFGRSSGLAGPYTLERYADDVDHLIQELALVRPMVVGFAFGGAVAMRLAVDVGDRLGGIVPVGIPSGELFPAESLSRSMLRDWPEYCGRSARAICGKQQSAATLSWLAAMFAATPLPVALETAQLLKEFEPTRLAPHVRIPALYIHGDQDEISPVDVARRCCELAPQSRLEVIADCGHLVPFDQREPFRAALNHFLTMTAKEL